MNRVVADFTAEATSDQKIRLKDLRGKNVVIYFYPKDSTPGCTTEGRDFSELHAKFKTAHNRWRAGRFRSRLASGKYGRAGCLA